MADIGMLVEVVKHTMVVRRLSGKVKIVTALEHTNHLQYDTYNWCQCLWDSCRLNI